MSIIIPLICTIIIEFAVYLIAIRKNAIMLLVYALLINGLTNPLVNLFFNIMSPTILVVEFFVIVVEVFLIKYLFEIKYWKAILISLIANIISFVVGFFVLSLI